MATSQMHRPNGYDSDQGKTQRAGQTKTDDLRSNSGPDDDGLRDTDEGGTSFKRDPNDRSEAISAQNDRSDLEGAEKSAPGDSVEATPLN